MDKLSVHERDKYNVIHQYCGVDEGQSGYGRQLELLLTDNSKFHKKWQELYKENKSFLEIGLGAGEIVKHLDKEGFDYCGVDISNWVVDEFRRRRGVEYMRNKAQRKTYLGMTIIVLMLFNIWTVWSIYL